MKITKCSVLEQLHKNVTIDLHCSLGFSSTLEAPRHAKKSYSCTQPDQWASWR